MASLCSVCVNNFFFKSTRTRNMRFLLKDTFCIKDEKLFKTCRSVWSSVRQSHYKWKFQHFIMIFLLTFAGISLLSCIYMYITAFYTRTYYFSSEYHLYGTTFVSFSAFTSTMKLKTHSQPKQNPFTGIDCLLKLVVMYYYGHPHSSILQAFIFTIFFNHYLFPFAVGCSFLP